MRYPLPDRDTWSARPLPRMASPTLNNHGDAFRTKWPLSQNQRNWQDIFEMIQTWWIKRCPISVGRRPVFCKVTKKGPRRWFPHRCYCDRRCCCCGRVSYTLLRCCLANWSGDCRLFNGGSGRKPTRFALSFTKQLSGGNESGPRCCWTWPLRRWNAGRPLK